MKKSGMVWKFAPVYDLPDNDVDVLDPELLAQESLAQLEEQMVMGALVNRDYEDELAQHGSTVNAHRPANFEGKRKGIRQAVTVQKAEAASIPVKLDQLLHTSFLIRDGEESMSFTNLVNYFIKPAVSSIASAVDQILCMQAYRFLGQPVGKLGTALAKSTVLSARERLNIALAPMGDRNLVLGPTMEGDLLGISEFMNAHSRGDDGSAQKEGHIGDLFGFGTYMSQNAPTVGTGSTVTAGAVNLSAGYAAGTTTLVVNGITGRWLVGAYITIAGDMVPHRITAETDTGGNTTGITITPALQSAVAHQAVITYYTPGAVNLSAGYTTGYDAALTVNGFSVAPKQGQLIGLGTGIYGAFGVPTTTSLILDRPLAADLAHQAVVGVGPAGCYGLAFHKDALALVNRPLPTPRSGTGASSAVVSYNNLSMRATITYDGYEQGHLVTIDTLMGVALFDATLGCLILR
jgi:hypothetical protein